MAFGGFLDCGGVATRKYVCPFISEAKTHCFPTSVSFLPRVTVLVNKQILHLLPVLPPLT